MLLLILFADNFEKKMFNSYKGRWFFLEDRRSNQVDSIFDISKMIFFKLVLGLQWESKITKSKVIEENHWTLIDMGGT